MNEVKTLTIKARISSHEFRHYNGREPESDMELHTYAEKVKAFMQEAIDAEDNRMTGGLWID